MSAVLPLLPDKRVKLLGVDDGAAAAAVPRHAGDLPRRCRASPSTPGARSWCRPRRRRRSCAKLNAATHAALNDPAVQKRLTELGFVVTPDSPEQLAAHLKAEYTRTGNLIRDANIKN